MKHGTERRKGKVALLKNLQKRFGNVQTEVSFPWLMAPDLVKLPDELLAIRKALICYRGHDRFDKPGSLLRCDFFLPDLNLIIEVDERQHFTVPRRIALENYPKDMMLGFNRDEWIAECSRVAAKDGDPIDRDEQRAYYDSIRDILVPKNGLQPIFRVNEAILRTTQGTQSVIADIDFLERNQAMQFRVATVCVEGESAKSAKENTSRIKLLHRVVQEINQLKWSPEVILFPGGYFYLSIHVGPLEHESRIKQIAKQPFSKGCIEASKSSGAVIVAGVDGEPWLRPGYAPDQNDSGDQLCTAWDQNGIVGLGRKVFPTAEEADKLVIYIDDMSSPHRLSSLGNDRWGLLCSCYDMFGCSETGKAPGTRSSNIQWLGRGKKEPQNRKSEGNSVRSAIKDGLSGWEKMVKKANLGLAAIHFFSQTGVGSGKGYWQLHGIQKASKVLRGKLAFGAAHFEALPKPEAVVLAAANGHRIEPVYQFLVNSEINALVRFFKT